MDTSTKSATLMPVDLFANGRRLAAAPFIEKITVGYGVCLGIGASETLWRHTSDTDTYSSGGLAISVPGPILQVSKNTLRTDSVIVDAVLGQGEALDCYNQKAQDADATRRQLENMVTAQQIMALDGLTTPKEKVELYKKIFGTCCDVPQTQIVP